MMILCTCKYFKYRYAMRHWSHASEYVKVVFGSMTTFKKIMKNLDDFSIETPYNIMGSQNTRNLCFGFEN